MAEQVNISLSDEDTKAIEIMMKNAGYDNRSAFVRGLIRQEWARQASQPNPVITLEEIQTTYKEQ